MYIYIYIKLIKERIEFTCIHIYIVIYSYKFYILYIIFKCNPNFKWDG